MGRGRYYTEREVTRITTAKMKKNRERDQIVKDLGWSARKGQKVFNIDRKEIET